MARLILHGDKDRAILQKAGAMRELAVLKRLMSFQSLKQDKRLVGFDDGTQFLVSSRFGQDTVEIFVPRVEIGIVKEQKEQREISFERANLYLMVGWYSWCFGISYIYWDIYNITRGRRATYKETGVTTPCVKAVATGSSSWSVMLANCCAKDFYDTSLLRYRNADANGGGHLYPPISTGDDIAYILSGSYPYPDSTSGASFISGRTAYRSDPGPYPVRYAEGCFNGAKLKIGPSWGGAGAGDEEYCYAWSINDNQESNPLGGQFEFYSPLILHQSLSPELWSTPDNLAISNLFDYQGVTCNTCNCIFYVEELRMICQVYGGAARLQNYDWARTVTGTDVMNGICLDGSFYTVPSGVDPFSLHPWSLPRDENFTQFIRDFTTWRVYTNKFPGTSGFNPYVVICAREPEETITVSLD